MDEFWANLDYTIYSGNTKLTAKEICRRYDLKRLQQQQSVKDQSQSVVIDLEPANRPKSPPLHAQSSASNDDKTEYIVIKTEEKTVNENLDAVNRTKLNNANANAIINKHFDLKRNDVNTATMTLDAITNRINGTVNIINTDNNNNSGNNSNSSKNNNNSSNNTNNRLSNLNNMMFRLPSNANANAIANSHASGSGSGSAGASASASADLRRHFNFAYSSPFGSSASSSTTDNVVDAPEITSTNFQQNSNSLSSKV